MRTGLNKNDNGSNREHGSANGLEIDRNRRIDETNNASIGNERSRNGILMKIVDSANSFSGML